MLYMEAVHLYYVVCIESPSMLETTRKTNYVIMDKRLGKLMMLTGTRSCFGLPFVLWLQWSVLVSRVCRFLMKVVC